MRVKVINKRPASVLQKKRVCAYARVSTDSRRQEDSLENQMETYERLITGNPEYEFIGVFADQGISGYCENRPQFQRMMEKARAGEIDLIITKSISRFARNTVTVLKFARELKELGVGIFFEEQNINTLSGDGEMMLAVLASFAQEESRSMSENNKWSIRKKFERGEVMITTSRFLGYDKNEYGDLIVNRKEAEIVSLTFDLYLMNVGSSRIGELLDYLGVKTVTGTTWESGTINGLLCNEKYKGDFHLQKYYTPENKRNHTRKEEQLLSYENQVNYYTNYISENPLYEYAGTYADEGISGTNTKKRDEFNRMIADCRAGKIDMIITKSISRFARNTLDCLNYVRELKDLGIGIIFEKENINTLDAKGEVLLTILSSLAQDESRSISENCTWGIRRRFETGKHKMSTKRFLGYDTDETGKLVINRTQEPIVVRLYQEFMDGKTTDYIKRIFEREGVKNWDGGTKWQSTTLMSMLENEKYKGDALLQKSYTVDFLTKKRTQNKGEIQMFYVEDDHDAIISKRIWECVQLEIKRRKKYLEEHGTNSYSHRPESNPFASKIICGDCNKVFARKGWRSSTGVDRKVWQCSERYKVKGVMGCANRHVEEETLIKAYLMAWNALVENREDFMEQWTEQLQSENLLEGYRAEKFIEYTDGAEPLTEMDTDFMLKTLDHIKVFEDGTLLVVFLDGTEIECKNEEE